MIVRDRQEKVTHRITVDHHDACDIILSHLRLMHEDIPAYTWENVDMDVDGNFRITWETRDWSDEDEKEGTL